MKKIKLYQYGLVTLLLLNLGLLSFFFLHKPPPPHHRPGLFHAKAIDILQLDDQQIQTFDAVAKQHGSEIRALSSKRRTLINEYFQQLHKPVNLTEKEEAMQELLNIEREKIEVTYAHFAKVKALLKENQWPAFEMFMEEALKVILKEPRKSKKPF